MIYRAETLIYLILTRTTMMGKYAELVNTIVLFRILKRVSLKSRLVEKSRDTGYFPATF